MELERISFNKILWICSTRCLQNIEKCLAFLCIENNACCPNALIEAQIIGKPIIGPNNGSFEMCPLPNIQLLKNSTKIDIELESLINDYLNNYEIWKNKSIFFPKKHLVPNNMKNILNSF